jgi:hypothetical protein
MAVAREAATANASATEHPPSQEARQMKETTGEVSALRPDDMTTQGPTRDNRRSVQTSHRPQSETGLAAPANDVGGDITVTGCWMTLKNED